MVINLARYWLIFYQTVIANEQIPFGSSAIIIYMF